ncbi:MAG: sodium-dependent transporter [Leptolyngbya sp. SIO4C1]|nr:sodium-dependent transporter [Leptolyngbya sp. SIO4C1]
MSRQRWSSKTVFVLAAIGSAVGLGNIWRFPYLAGKYGGGAFLIPYLIALLAVGFPLLMLEFAIGQKMQQGAVGAFKRLHPKFQGFGMAAVLSGFIIIAYYAVVMAWALVYLFASFRVSWADSAEQYFFDSVLHISEGVGHLGGVNLPILLALIAVWILIYFCVWRGTQSEGSVVVYSVPLPVILLSVLLLRAITLPGCLDGWQLYLKPSWRVLADPEVWSAAFSQIFFTLSLAFGTMLTYASYKSPDDDIVSDTWVTALTNSAISIFSGFVVFGVLGYMASQTATPIAELAASGPGLAFVIFPQALSLMPLPGLFSALFFLMLISLGIDSAFSLVEAVNTVFLDRKPHWKIEQVSFWVCLTGLLAGIVYTTQAGLYYLDIVDHFVTHYSIMLAAIAQAILGGWVYGAESLRRYINAVSNWQIGAWWSVSVKYVIPVSLAVLLFAQLSTDLRSPYEGYPSWALGIGWALVLMSGGIMAAPFCIPARPAHQPQKNRS